jgi:hypothetical protein
MVSPARLRRGGWPIAVALAAGFLAVVALHGGRPEPGLARFEASGLLADWPAQRIVAVEIGTNEGRSAFRRDPQGGWHRDPADGPTPSDAAESIETGLTLLRNAAPRRRDLPGGQIAEFGLAPPRLIVIARNADGASRTIEFGGLNPLGLERYARTEGEIMLLPSYLVEAWEQVVARR